MGIAILWILLIILVTIWASKWERSGGIYFVVALVLSPLVAGLILLIEGRGGKKCPKCKENIRSDAEVCKHCGFEYNEETETS